MKRRQIAAGGTRRKTPAAWPLLGERAYDPAELPHCERDYKSGDKAALAHAIAICACADIKLPEWAAHAYLHGFNEVREFKAKSWDSVLGKPAPKGAHPSAVRKRREKGFPVWLEVQRHSKRGASIDNEMFETVGKRFHLGRELTKQYYVREEARMRKAVSLFPGKIETAEALRLLTQAALEALERSETAASERERAAARAALWSLKGRFQGFFTRG